MANLETLELTISANSASATKEIANLTSSLISLGNAIKTPLQMLTQLNRQLGILRGFSNMKMPNIGGMGGRTGKYRQASTPISMSQAMRMINQTSEKDLMIQKAQGMVQEYVSNATAGTMNYRQLAEGALGIKKVTDQIDKLGNASSTASKKTNTLMGSIARIAKTMLIRMAIKSLIQSFKDSWEAAYAFSSKMNGSFAKAVDASRTILADTATTIVQTFAPAIEALVPILNVVGNAIQYLCQGIQYLFGLLGMSSDLFGKNASSINKYIGSSDKANKSTKNLLASWDQLNVIQSKSSSNKSGSGSGYKPNSLKNMVSDELGAILSIITGEALLAVGLILACTGHIPLGVGLMAIGVASIAQTITEKWGELPNKIKGEIVEIMALVGASMLCIGAIITFAGANLPLGIGLMIAGVANMATAASLSWNLDDQIKREIGNILGIVGTGLLVIGLILALSGAALPLGIGMMIAGGASLAAAYALNWDTITGSVKSTLDTIGKFFEDTWAGIESAISSAWSAVTKWWEDTGIGPGIRKAWGEVEKFFTDLWGSTDTGTGIAGAAAIAWEYIKNVFTKIDIVDLFKKAWDSVSEFFSTLFGGTEVVGSIASFANDAWCVIQKFWTEDVLGFINDAWNGVSKFFMDLWGDSETGICGFFSGAWADISQLWGDIVGFVEKAWGGIGEWFYQNVTMPVANFFIDCINGIIDALNFFVRALNSIAIDIPSIDFGFLGKTNAVHLGFNIAEIKKLDKLLPHEANGAYGIPRGDLFIANEAGAELVGSMNGKTTVANQGQIIEGIRAGVRDANAEQNALLRQQNELLRNILDSSGSITVEPSAAWGKFNQRSAEMWSMATGR